MEIKYLKKLLFSITWFIKKLLLTSGLLIYIYDYVSDIHLAYHVNENCHTNYTIASCTIIIISIIYSFLMVLIGLDADDGFGGPQLQSNF